MGDREGLRRFFFDAWRKRRAGVALEPLEELVAAVIAEHPEYHPMLETAPPAGDGVLDDAPVAPNPFLHMGMHIAIREGLLADRPAGVALIHRRLCGRSGSVHEAEHRMMECLGECLWHAEREGRLPDEQAYLECLRAL